MPNNDWRTPPAFLVLPPGSSSGQRVVIGTPADGVIPADLIAYYAPETITAGIISFSAGIGYDYQIWLVDGVGLLYVAFGGKDNLGQISEAYRYFNTFGFAVNVVGYKAPGPVFSFRLDSILSIEDTTRVLLSTGTSLEIGANALLQIEEDSLYTIDTIPAARGLKVRVASTANTAAIGAVETVIMTTGAMTFKDGRAYEVLWHNRLSHSAAQFAALRVRQTNLAGASLIFWDFQVTAAVGTQHFHRAILVRPAGAGDLVDNLVLTMRATAGTVTSTGAVDIVRYLEVRDVGDAVDYPTEKTI